jgi:hypothetical protein
MVFGRRKDREAPKHMRKPVKSSGRDPFGHLRDDRAEAESGEPWFAGEDDGPELQIETNRSSNLTAEDIGGPPPPPAPPD